MSDSNAVVLIVDDDPAIGKVLGALLRQEGLDSVCVASAAAGMQALEQRAFDLVISDVRMPGMDGMQLLAQIAGRWPELPVVMLTAHGTVKLAVEAMRLGAADFVVKPFEREEIVYVVQKALRLTERARAEVPNARTPVDGALSESPAMSEVVSTLRRAAPTMATVLVRGESGTGKELVARAVHDQSKRASGAFIKVHCAALPDTLLESELFGYEKGAFTGAVSRKPGRVELAEGGTLFLDEIGDITPAMQVKLLRLLQDREYDRLGGTRTIQADVRFVAATHRNLEAMVEAGEFREDLFYRLSVVAIRLPPLRERPDDIERLARLFCANVAKLNGRSVELDDDAVDQFIQLPWRGNVRELHNLVERLVVLSDTSTIGAEDVKHELLRQPSLGGTAPSSEAPALLDARRQAAEKDAVVDALRRAKNNRTLAARILGISRRSLYAKLHEYTLL